MKLLFYLALISTLLCSCSSNEGTILPDSAALQPGDIVFRMGTSVESEIIKSAEERGEYSHVGIVAYDGDSLVIIHAVPDEHDFEGDVDRVKKESPTVFYAKDRASVGEVCRYKDSTVAKRASEIALEYYQRNVLFDSDFDDSDTTRLYCCELVNLAFTKAGHRLLTGPTHRHDLRPLKLIDCYLPSDVKTAEGVKTIYVF